MTLLVGLVRLQARRLRDLVTARIARRVVVRLVGVAVATGGLAVMGISTVGAPLSSGGFALAAKGGDSNDGDVWVDNVGQPSGPGHEHDPHLNCLDINIWGDKLADSSGTYTIDGWPPSGSQEQDYPAVGTAAWTYNATLGGPQVISVVPVATLIANAVANGDVAQAIQGFHFKLQLTQDPQKHKTFWVNCVPSTTTTTSTTSSTSSSSTSTTTSTTSSSSTTSTTSSTETTSTTATVPETTTTTVTVPETTTATVTVPVTTTATVTVPETTTTTVTVPETTTTTQTANSTVTVPSTQTVTTSKTVTAPASSSSSTSSSPASSATSSTGSPATTSTASISTGVGAATITPSTGADADFGVGLGLLVAGSGIVAAAGRFGRRRRN